VKPIADRFRVLLQRAAAGAPAEGYSSSSFGLNSCASACWMFGGTG
jgi:hypothetical protein